MAGTDVSPAVARIARRVITGLPEGGITPQFERFLSESPPAGVLLFRRDFGSVERLPELVRRLRGRAKPARLLVCVDEEGGFVSQIAPDLPTAPGARILGRAASATDLRAIAGHLGRNLRALGVDVDFAPVFDVDAEPANPVIGPRAFSSRPDEVIWLALTFARGLSEGGVLPCAKHFPGHGDTRFDSHLVLPASPASRGVLEERDLPPFRAAAASGLPLVMVSHVHYPALESVERPASLSPAVVDELLRSQLGFRGVVVTDALEMKAVADRHAPEVAAQAALEAGCDLLLYGAFTSQVERAIEGVAQALEAGRLDADRLAASDRRLARLAERLPAERDPEPSSEKVDSRAPVDLVSLCRRALRWVGGAPAREAMSAPGGWLVVEPEWGSGPSLASLLSESGIEATGCAWDALPASALERVGVVVLAHARRTAPTELEASAMGRAVLARPTVLVALGQDAFLSAYPKALGRLSACDPGEPMRRAVARLLTDRVRGPARATESPPVT